MQIEAIAQLERHNECLVIGIYEDGSFTLPSTQIAELGLSELLSSAPLADIQGKIGQSLLLYHHDSVQGSERILLIGCGQKHRLSVRQLKQIVAKTAEELAKLSTNRATIDFNALADENIPSARLTRFIVEGIAEKRYVYDAFKTQAAPTPTLQQLFLVGADERAINEAQAVAFGVKNAKDLANCPPNVCNPKYLAQCAQQLAADYPHIQTTIIDEAQMKALGMNAYLAVSQGSANEAFMSIIEYRNHPSAKPIVLIGKGMTFDSGGISIKPSEAMDEMKYDMGGAAAVYGTMCALAKLNLPINVIGVLAGCENMPDANAYRPGDIIKTMSGKTVEVLNTDAEGRMVLCDALTYAERFEPAMVVDIATLTGACMIALGAHNSGLIANDDQLATRLLNAAAASDDKAWRLPTGEEYQDQLKSNFADLAHIGGRLGGAITAGVFLSNFAQNYSWAHLDIAGTAWKSGAEKGATGRPVPLLTQFLLDIAAENQ